ncbi:glycosyltransferase [Candidatus Gracilibacteria bacterium]|nr:glycosyltransferase [Candidatus Gracilibacteria bacterium]NJM87631.1 glycosyltransferase [Hydrococcus sp. RU_2_2]NJP19211.1 glycosyltransferase [Hydrococcus sp. CRU_1_1]
MKILQIIPSVSLVYGGPSQMVLGLSAALAKEGIDVTIISTNSNGDAGQPPLDVPIGKLISQDGYQILYFPCSPFRRYKFSFDLLRWLAIHAKEYDLAHIHALFSPVCTAAATVARSRKLPYILRPLGTLDPADLQKKRQLKQLYGYLLERPNLAGSAAIHFTSEEECKISERFGVQTKDLVIPLGVNIPEELQNSGQIREKFGIERDRPLILFMSRIDPKKGLDLLIPALEKLLEARLQFHFVLAGTNPQDPNYEKQIRDRIATSQLSNCTTITGFVAGEFKQALLQEADLFVLPSYYENFGIAVTEAMAVGTPVVISDRVYIWEDVQKADAGWVSSTNVESLTETLTLALRDVEDRKLKSINARKLVIEQYSWGAIAKQTIAAYTKVVREFRSSGVQ